MASPLIMHDHDPVVGLQAADWLAYEYWLDAERLQYEANALHHHRKAFREFTRLPGRVLNSWKGPRIKQFPFIS